MAVFFTQRTVDDAVQQEMPEAQRRLLQQFEGNKQLQKTWEEHAEKCETAQEGLVIVKRQNIIGGQETKETSGSIYSKSSVSFGCACRQLFFTADEKGNVTAKESSVGKEEKPVGYLAEEKTTSLYSQRL